jgi:hypothetical protein
MKLLRLFSLTAGVTALLLWSLQKEEQPKNWIEEPSDELMDYKVK